ncbi:NAD-dependent epimerase/dehydratase family protein [Scytonema millei]|uniref:NAD-dependent epimerase/dehydratase family protein n=1 Tax=Scytonema millei VB511283 TaxID=1245923 RepID=A0A9X5EE15_9CYAN|nr:NAD-dependent epimerase/dehydratase family protein [Scytonema millei]NHC38037.1 NAD-dependent epimerase/dehydratase family protein [Scytonema millei VB511283]
MVTQSRAVLVTGAAGFIGRYVSRYFLRQGWTVIGIDTSSVKHASLLNLSAYYQIHLPDMALGDLLQKHSPQVCIHCAGSASVNLSVTDPAKDFYANTGVTFELLNTLRLNAPDCRFIFLSSAAVYGNPQSLPVSESHSPLPVSPYGFHKWQCEQLCLEFTNVYGLPTASARIFSAYGPGLRRQVVWDIFQKIITQRSPTLQGTGRESRDFIHAIDIAAALFVIATTGSMQGEVYNIGSGREVTITELVSLVLDTLCYDCNPEFDGVVPIGVPLYWKADTTKLSALGFDPTVSLEQGISSFANWCRAELVGI